MGYELPIYFYNEGEKDYVANFTQVTQCVGHFLVSHNANETFV